MPAKTDNVRSFAHTLQRVVSLEDDEWKFNIPYLPSDADCDRHELVKAISLATKNGKHQMALRLQHIEKNRAISGDPLHQFVHISFADFRAPRSSSAADKSEFPTQPATPRECTDYSIKLLRKGIFINGVHYNFYGHSNSQLKSRTCFLFAASKEEISRKVEALGEFGKMKTVGKKAKRIGLLFSVARAAMTVDPERCLDIPDIETPDYVFTDGCGLVSPRLAKELARKVNIMFRNVRYTPSVFQIRYRGYKGVVTLDPAMKSAGPTLLKMRKSMKKFNGGDDLSFSVVEYSKPYTFGYLNDEVIVLLDALGIARPVFLKKQVEHLHFLSEAGSDPRTAFRFLCYINMPDLAEKVMMESLESVRPRIQKLVNAEYAKMLNKRDEQKCRILIPKSRLLFGVCDAWGVLKEGQCAVKITMDGDGQPYALKNTEVIVTRNPCLHPGDLQKFKVVERPELTHMVDCIVFPAIGRRPAADMMSGGDLDGDTFFVSWDTDIIPSLLSQPAHYPGAREPIKFKLITDDDRLVYFAKYNNVSLGKVKNLYLDWARVKGPMSPECQELNRLFSQCVDGNQIKVPQKLQNPPRPNKDTPKFILDDLHEEARKGIHKGQRIGASPEVYDMDAMELLLSRDGLPMSEFELIKLTALWCRKNGVLLEDYLDFFDFNVLTAEEKAWALSQLPHIPADSLSFISNALCSSNLVSEAELVKFRLNHPGIKWKRVFDTSSGQHRLATFLDSAARTMETFHKTLLVFRPDERLTVAIYVPCKVERSQDVLVDDTVRLLAFPHSQGEETAGLFSRSTKKNYRLHCDENVLDLFEGERRNTWVRIIRGPSDDSNYRSVPRRGDWRRARQVTLDTGQNFDFRASIALDKFSRGLQTHIGRVQRSGITAAVSVPFDTEIYVISNRDTKSMQNLDLWLEYIDTDEVLPLFDQKAKEYSLPTLSGVDWAVEPSHIVQIAKMENLAPLGEMATALELTECFKWLWEKGQRGMLLRSYEYLIATIGEEDPAFLESSVVIHTMVSFLDQAPFLSVVFSRLENRAELPGDVVLALETRGVDVLRAHILSINAAGALIAAPFRRALSQVASLPATGFAGLVELVALTVSSPDIAMDILLESLESESSRLLSHYDDATIHHFAQNMIAISLNHIGEVQEEQEKQSPREELLELSFVSTTDDGYSVVEVNFRIDAPWRTPEPSSHVRFVTASPPSNTVLDRNYFMDALVTQSQQGIAKFQCFHPLPPFLKDCSWKLQYCGSFATTRTMFDAVRAVALGGRAQCGIADQILGVRTDCSAPDVGNEEFPLAKTWEPKSKLNPSQRAAVDASIEYPLTCLWGPPGTGKTQTVVEIIQALQMSKESRILVTAPTHNAVDNIMRRYMAQAGHEYRTLALRVSTEVRKVSEDLRKYTCDAMVGEEIYASHAAMKQAKQRVKKCRIVFTTCIGAGLGLLRSQQDFDVVIIDEASQQTEPESLVPLTKGCRKAVLVGDHVQLRPTVQQHAALLDFDVSLFERLHEAEGDVAREKPNTIARLMLDTQYRMHPSICHAISREFYGGKLQTGITSDERPLRESLFPWPRKAGASTSANRGPAGRMVFVECTTIEEMGLKSKLNKGQADVCHRICDMLCSGPKPTEALVPDASKGSKSDPKTQKSSRRQDKETQSEKDNIQLQPQSIAVLTPYTKQVEHTKRLLASVGSADSATDLEVSSIDGFQGREADIVVFVSVRCNEHGEIGFLRDLRRLNVALTRARKGVIVVGSRGTLTGRGKNRKKGQDDEAVEEAVNVWRSLLDKDFMVLEATELMR
ncbi:hypothetical protein MKZ38_004413 [Zalerion maritima]|uniref:AAA+ ATPase domain-containing protein n=1 Tax=Zalerion maritima TaxID=339359 RepID=A0AAD5RM53_9PEZI|nr:hypothetical protein MKZ38_004413 [Zalerion maritima]